MAVTAQKLMDIWESGRTRSPLENALQLVRAANPKMSAEQLAALSIGRLDCHLLALREWMFGPDISLLVDCDDCGQRIEVAFNMADIRHDAASDPVSPRTIEVDSCEAQFRLPTCRDMLALAETSDADESRRRLLQCCVISVTRAGQQQCVDELDEETVATIAAAMAAADPQANLLLPISCPECDRRWQSSFDIVSYLWAEIGAWAQRVLVEVRILAGRYHWSERDILAMSPWRRQFYISGVES